MRTIQDVLHRLRAEYMEMPGLRLKAQQVQRLCGIEPTMCQAVLDALVAEGFLSAKADGHYARLTDGQHPHSAEADVRADTLQSGANHVSEGIVSLPKRAVSRGGPNALDRNDRDVHRRHRDADAGHPCQTSR
jgi:hypothetical protein